MRRLLVEARGVFLEVCGMFSLWRGPFVVASGLLSSCGMRVLLSLVEAGELSSCVMQAWLPRSMWALSSMTKD